MPFEATLDLLTLRRDGVDASQWPRLSCSQAQQAALAGSDLRLDAGREVLFQDQGQIRAFDDTHRLVFNRAGGLLELHEQGAIRFLTGAPAPAERLRILATGQVGLGTATPTQALDVVGTVKAIAFEGDGAALTGVSGTDATKVAKAGDTMTGPLAITAAGTGLRVTNNAAVGGTLTVTGNVGIGPTNPTQLLTLSTPQGTRLEITPTSSTLPWSQSSGQISAGSFVINQQSQGSSEPGADLALKRDGKNRVVLGDVNTFISSQQGGDILFYVNLDEPPTLQVMRITGLGQVGIGTTTPRNRLGVRGIGPHEEVLSFEDSTGSTKWHINQNLGGNNPGFNVVETGVADGRLFIKTGGNVGIGTVNPAYKLDVAGSAHATSFPTSSDERFKREVRPLTHVLEKLDKIRGVSFEWNERYESLGRATGHREIGVIAQEVEAVFPELVTTWGEASYRAIDYGRLTAILVEAIKQLRAETEALKQSIEAP